MSKSSPRSVAPLHLEPRPSRLLRRLLLLIHLGGAALSLFLPLGWALHGAVPAILIWSCVRAWRRTAAIPALTWDGDGQWWLNADAGDVPLQLLPDSFISPRLVVLLFRRDGGHRVLAVPLLSDSLEAQTLRRLRAGLRQRAQFSGR